MPINQKGIINTKNDGFSMRKWKEFTCYQFTKGLMTSVSILYESQISYRSLAQFSILVIIGW